MVAGGVVFQLRYLAIASCKTLPASVHFQADKMEGVATIVADFSVGLGWAAEQSAGFSRLWEYPECN